MKKKTPQKSAPRLSQHGLSILLEEIRGRFETVTDVVMANQDGLKLLDHKIDSLGTRLEQEIVELRGALMMVQHNLGQKIDKIDMRLDSHDEEMRGLKQINQP